MPLTSFYSERVCAALDHMEGTQYKSQGTHAPSFILNNCNEYSLHTCHFSKFNKTQPQLLLLAPTFSHQSPATHHRVQIHIRLETFQKSNPAEPGLSDNNRYESGTTQFRCS